MTDTATADIDALKTRLKATWMDGNYDYFSRFMESSAVEFLDRLGVQPGISLLDVACGSGQVGLIAARRGARVTGVDIATNAIQAARGRATAEGLDARFARATPRRCRAGCELTSSPVSTVRCSRRVPARGRRVAAGVPPGRDDRDGQLDQDGFIGRMFATFARFIAPPGMPAPVLWGEEGVVRERFAAGVSDLRLSRVNAGSTIHLRRPRWWSSSGGTAGLRRAFATLGTRIRRRRAALVDLELAQSGRRSGRTVVDGSISRSSAFGREGS